MERATSAVEGRASTDVWRTDCGAEIQISRSDGGTKRTQSKPFKANAKPHWRIRTTGTDVSAFDLYYETNPSWGSTGRSGIHKSARIHFRALQVMDLETQRGSLLQRLPATTRINRCWGVVWGHFGVVLGSLSGHFSGFAEAARAMQAMAVQWFTKQFAGHRRRKLFSSCPVTVLTPGPADSVIRAKWGKFLVWRAAI